MRLTPGASQRDERRSMENTERQAASIDHAGVHERRPTDGRETYVPPEVRLLGTLADLTLGGTSGPDDGVGGAGDSGSLTS
jgi:hypothetical protein